MSLTGADLVLTPLSAVDEAWTTWPRGDRPGALRAAAVAARVVLSEGAPVDAVRTIDLALVPVPAARALAGLSRSLAPTVLAVHRLVVVRFRGHDGTPRTLLWEPRVADRPATGAESALGRQRDTVTSALALLGVPPTEVDVLAVSHLHDLDPRLLVGTTFAVADDRVAREPLLPNASLLVQRRELDTLRAPHPAQRERYRGTVHGIRMDRVRELDGSVVLGEGVALVATPGHTDGHQSLVLRTSTGIWVLSGNGHAADAWHPHLSRQPGVRRYVDHAAAEVLVGRDAEDAVDQHDAMLLERALADAHREDPRWRCVLPSAELVPTRRAWPLRPTFVLGGLDVGLVRARD